MKKKKDKIKEDCCKKQKENPIGAVYGFGVLGAAIYFISNAQTFWMVILGILKSLVWPVLIVYEILKFFNL